MRLANPIAVATANKPQATKGPVKVASRNATRDIIPGHKAAVSSQGLKKRDTTPKPKLGDAARRGRDARKSAPTEARANTKPERTAKSEPKVMRDVCKSRPKDTRPKGGGGSGKRWIPWC